MKYIPILFTGAMVRAILEDRKTKTRRVVKPQPKDGRHLIHFDGLRWYTRNAEKHGIPYDSQDWKCPYGAPGDRLWVRETFALTTIDNDIHEHPGVAYRCDNEDLYDGHWTKWRPSIFMPRWASRITLEVTDVKVERVQDISVDDCKAEGVGSGLNEFGVRYAFGQLWNQINGGRGYGWNSNPWVWVVSFRRIQP